MKKPIDIDKFLEEEDIDIEGPKEKFKDNPAGLVKSYFQKTKVVLSDSFLTYPIPTVLIITSIILFFVNSFAGIIVLVIGIMLINKKGINVKKCKFCGEEIKEEAIKCKYCGSDLTNKEDSEDSGDNEPIVGKKKTSRFLIYTFLVLAIPVIALYLIAISNNNLSPVENNNTSQIMCGTSAQKAYELFKEKNSGENFPEIDGTKENKKDETATIDFKYNYKSDLSLCFIEYVITMRATTIDTNEPIQGNSKIVTALVSDITKQQTLAGFAKTSYPTGSQKIIGCIVQTSGHYDDLNQKPIKDLLSPTQCSSESEFDSLVSKRFGIK